MIPLLELRGGLLAASLLKISAAKAIPLCIVGNIIPIPFILLFIRQIFKVLKKTKLFRGLVMKLEDRAMRKSDQVKKYEFLGLMLFVGIPRHTRYPLVTGVQTCALPIYLFWKLILRSPLWQFFVALLWQLSLCILFLMD